MQTVPLSPKLSDAAHEIERTEEAAIVGEIAVHIIEYRDKTSASRAVSLIQKLYAIQSLNKDAFWIVLHLLTGDLAAITDSYSEQAAREALDKQAIQQRMERALKVLELHYPDLCATIIQLRHITAKIS